MNELAVGASVAEEAPKSDDGDDLLRDARDRYKKRAESWQHNRDGWLEDANFRALDQWPKEIKDQRGKKPCLVVDKTNQYVRQVVNDGRQNRPGIKVRPVDDKSDEKVADGFQGMIRGICNESNADEAFDTALDHAAGCGFGYFRVVTEYEHERTFNQVIRVRRVRNPLAVLLGPHYLADGSDADFGFFIDDVPKDRFKRKYPKAKQVDWTSDGFEDGWSTDETVRVCEYFYKVSENELVHLLVDGTCVSDEEYKRSSAQSPLEVPAIEKSRPIPTSKVKWCRFTGAEVLEKNDWLGKYIPIIPVYGNESDIEGKVTYSGLIRAAKDPQRLYNYARSKFAERVALTPQAPWLIAEGQVEGHEDVWKSQNIADKAALVYRATELAGRPVPPPQRISPSDVPSGFAEDMKISEHDIQASMGMYAASVGQPSNEKSGKAIMARQREGDTATFHYQDNLNRAIRYLGRILVDLIPKVYDSRRVVRMLGEDGKARKAIIDKSIKAPFLKSGSTMIYNLSAGIYDVSLEAGPSYTTRRVESADAMLELVRANPEMWRTHGDLIVKAQDWPGADEFARRSRLTLPPELRDAIEQGEDDPESADLNAARAQVRQVIKEAQDAIAQRDQALQEADKQIAQLEQALKNKAAEATAKLQDSDTKEYEARTERMVALEPAITPEFIAQIVQKTVMEIMAQPAPAQSIQQSPVADLGEPPQDEPYL